MFSTMAPPGVAMMIVRRTCGRVSQSLDRTMGSGSVFESVPVLSEFVFGVWLVVLLRIQGLGFKHPTHRPFFAGERKSGSSRQGSESLLPGKKHPKLPAISPIWATFGTNFFFAVFNAFLRV
jgi:hypothetical protein